MIGVHLNFQCASIHGRLARVRREAGQIHHVDGELHPVKNKKFALFTHQEITSTLDVTQDETDSNKQRELCFFTRKFPK